MTLNTANALVVSFQRFSFSKWMIRGLLPGTDKGFFFSSPNLSDRRCDTPNLLLSGYRNYFFLGGNRPGVDFSTYLQLASRLRVRLIMSLFSVYAFMFLEKTTLPLTFQLMNHVMSGTNRANMTVASTCRLYIQPPHRLTS